MTTVEGSDSDDEDVLLPVVVVVVVVVEKSCKIVAPMLLKNSPHAAQIWNQSVEKVGRRKKKSNVERKIKIIEKKLPRTNRIELDIDNEDQILIAPNL